MYYYLESHCDYEYNYYSYVKFPMPTWLFDMNSVYAKYDGYIWYKYEGVKLGL